MDDTTDHLVKILEDLNDKTFVELAGFLDDITTHLRTMGETLGAAVALIEDEEPETVAIMRSTLINNLVIISALDAMVTELRDDG